MATVSEVGEAYVSGHQRRWEGFGFLAPLLLFALIVFDVPLLIVVFWSFNDPETGFPSLETMLPSLRPVVMPGSSGERF